MRQLQYRSIPVVTLVHVAMISLIPANTEEIYFLITEACNNRENIL